MSRRPGRRLTPREAAALHRAIDLAYTAIAWFHTMQLSLKGAKPETLRRQLKDIEKLLPPRKP
jgi:hypothetical protein